METNKKGEKVLRQTSAIVYKTNDKYAYVVSKDLKTGIIISETDKQKIYTIKDSDKVEILGVYMVNKGYAVLLWWIWLKGMEIIALFLLPAVK